MLKHALCVMEGVVTALGKVRECSGRREYVNKITLTMFPGRQQL